MSHAYQILQQKRSIQTIDKKYLSPQQKKAVRQFDSKFRQLMTNYAKRGKTIRETLHGSYTVALPVVDLAPCIKDLVQLGLKSYVTGSNRTVTVERLFGKEDTKSIWSMLKEIQKGGGHHSKYLNNGDLLVPSHNEFRNIKLPKNILSFYSNNFADSKSKLNLAYGIMFYNEVLSRELVKPFHILLPNNSDDSPEKVKLNYSARVIQRQARKYLSDSPEKTTSSTDLCRMM